MKNEPQTTSELMMQNQMLAEKPTCVLPNETVRRFLLEVIDQTNFPGKMSGFVSSVKDVITGANLAE